MNGRSIQDIIPPARSKPIRPQVPNPTPPPPPPPQPPRSEEHYSMEPSRSKNTWIFAGIGVGAVVLVAVVIGLMSTVFHTARAEVTVSEWKSDISGTYEAGGDAALSYQPVVVNETAQKSVPATGSAEAKDHAFGTIVISNMGTQQRLITNTRFQTKEGLIYRIHVPIVVPAATTKNGVKTAATIEAVVYADEAGEKYNIGVTTFTVPGLKGSPQFDLITAQSKTPMSGGFVGRRATVEKSVRDQAVTELRAELDRTLRDKALASAPPGSVIFTDSIDILYTEAPDQGEGSTATVTVNGTAVAPAFSADAISLALAERAQVSSDAPLTLANPTELTYTAATGGNVQSGSAISFTLAGSAHLVAAFNPAELSDDLAGKTEEEAESVRTQYPSLIGPLTIKVYPFWLHTLPENPERISVTVRGALDQNE